MDDVTLKQAEAILSAAVKKAGEIGAKMNVAVVGWVVWRMGTELH